MSNITLSVIVYAPCLNKTTIKSNKKQMISSADTFFWMTRYIDRVTYRPMYQKRRTKESFSVHFESLPLQIHHQRPYNISLTSYDMNVELFLLPILLKHLLEAFRPQLLIVVGEPLEKRKWIFDDRFLVQSHRRRIRNCAWNRSLSPMLSKKEK